MVVLPLFIVHKVWIHTYPKLQHARQKIKPIIHLGQVLTTPTDGISTSKWVFFDELLIPKFSAEVLLSMKVDQFIAVCLKNEAPSYILLFLPCAILHPNPHTYFEIWKIHHTRAANWSWDWVKSKDGDSRDQETFAVKAPLINVCDPGISSDKNAWIP